jgi:hypothetical protein
MRKDLVKARKSAPLVTVREKKTISPSLE